MNASDSIGGTLEERARKFTTKLILANQGLSANLAHFDKEMADFARQELEAVRTIGDTLYENGPRNTNNPAYVQAWGSGVLDFIEAIRAYAGGRNE